MERRHRPSPLMYWACEREAIRLRRVEGRPPPWTQDRILQQYRFCNLRRRDDRVSQWLIGNVLAHRNLGFSEWSYLQFTALCRWINWPPTIRELRGVALWPVRELNLLAIGEFIDQYCASGEKAWTGAYMVRAAPRRQYGELAKGKFVAEVVVGEGLESVRKPLLNALKLREAQAVWEALNSANNWGSFMAGQVVADWSYTPLLATALDLQTWAPMGPGSIRGFNRMLGRPLNQRPQSEEWSERLQGWRQELITMLGLEYKDLTLHDIQNALCETDKYLRVKNGEGRPRSTYAPETAY